MMVGTSNPVFVASRYAKLAAELAAKEEHPQRKKELQEIAEICEWVPENPARTFRESSRFSALKPCFYHTMQY